MRSIRASCGAGAAAIVLVQLGISESYGAANSIDSSSTPDQVLNILNDTAQHPSLFTFDYGPPANPALAIAGLSSSKITAATSLKPFLISLPTLFDSGSGDQSAAFDLAPAWALGQSRSVTAEEYANTYSEQFWFRTRIGGVVYKGNDGGGDPTKAKASKIAASLSFSFLPTSDPLATPDPSGLGSAWLGCKTRQAKAISDSLYYRFGSGAPQELANMSEDFSIWRHSPITPEQQPALETLLKKEEALYKSVTGRTPSAAPGATLQDELISDSKDVDGWLAEKTAAETQANQGLQKVLTGCQKEASNVAQHGADLQLAGGIGESGTPGELSGFQELNAVVWAGGRVPLVPLSTSKDCSADDDRGFFQQLGRCWLVGASARYSNNETVASEIKSMPSLQANVVEAWGGLEQITSSWTLGAYAGYSDDHARDASQSASSSSGTRWLVTAAYSLDKLIGDGVWVEASYGNAQGSTASLNDKTFLLALSWGPPKIESPFGNRK